MTRNCVRLVLVLLLSASAAAQEAKVYTNADLRKPIARERKTVDPAVLAGFKEREELAKRITFGAGGFGGYWEPAPVSAPVSDLQYRATLAAMHPPHYSGRYASQPLYPVVYSYSSYRPSRIVAPAPRLSTYCPPPIRTRR
jgi:hypothetical protein